MFAQAIVAATAAFVVIAGASAAAAAGPSSAPSPGTAASSIASPASAPDFPADIEAAKNLQRKGRAREAIALLAADHRLDPANRDVTVALARTYSYSGDQGAAIAILDALLKASPDDVDARVFLAQAYAFNHDFAAAEAQYGTALSAAPADEDAQVGLAQTLTFEGKYSDAKAMFQKVLAHDPHNYDALVGLAGAEGFSGDYYRARTDYQTVLSAQPENTDALVGLATVDFWLNNVTAATALDNRALAIDPGDSDATELKKQLTIKTAPQLVASLTTSHSNDGSTFDYQLAERYYTAPSTSVGLVQELYEIVTPTLTVRTHRLGIVATYQGSNQFGADLRIVGSKFGGQAQVTDSVLSVNGANAGFDYGLGVSTGGVDGSVRANGGQSAPNSSSALVRINALFGNVGYTRRANSVNLSIQDASYNDGNRFHEFNVNLTHQIGIGAFTSITPGISLRLAGFSNTYNSLAQAIAPGYYAYKSQRDIVVYAAAERQLTPRFSAGMVGSLGERRTVVPIYSYTAPTTTYSPGTLPFQKLEPYFDYEGDRFSMTATLYDDHYTGNGAVEAFAATTIDFNIAIRLP